MIRIAVRYLSITLGHKSKATAVDKQELWLLNRGLQRFTVNHTPIDDESQSHRVNIGYLPASTHTMIKTDPAASSKKMIVTGSLVTSILEFFGIEVPLMISSEKCQTKDKTYLGNCGIVVPNF